MGFVKQNREQLTETVKFKLPKGNNQFDDFSIKVTYVVNTTSTIKKRQDMFAENVINVDAGLESNPECDDKHMLRQDVKNIEGVVDPDSQEKVEFDDDLLEYLMEIREILSALITKWAEVNYGQQTIKKINRKNV